MIFGGSEIIRDVINIDQTSASCGWNDGTSVRTQVRSRVSVDASPITGSVFARRVFARQTSREQTHGLEYLGMVDYINGRIGTV